MADPRAAQFFGVEYGNSASPKAAALEGPLVVPYNGSILWKDASGNYWQQYLEDLGDGNPTLRTRQVNLP